MNYPALITSDLHLTEQPSTEYRWALFPWLNEQIKFHKVKTVLCLGDVTDAKDRHPAALVNRIVSAFDSLACDDVRIMAGNHDWLKRGEEFFRFLNRLPHVQFITTPYHDPDCDCLFLPHSKNPGRDWDGYQLGEYQFVFMHQTVKGAVASNGQEMEGEQLPDFKAIGRPNQIQDDDGSCAGPIFYSGDIHVPQRINGVTYIGSPYHVHFGDDFKPRCLLLDADGGERNLHFESSRRVVADVSSLGDLKAIRFRQGDQVKLRMELAPSERHAWAAIRRQAVDSLLEQGVEVQGVELKASRGTARPNDRRTTTPGLHSPSDHILKFVEREELGGAAYEAAMQILETKR